MYKLSIGTKDDIEEILHLANQFYSASPYKDFGLAEDKIIDCLEENANSPNLLVLLLKSDEKAIGLLIACAVELPFSRDKISIELAWWINEEHRGTRWSLEMLNAYEYWSKNVANCKACQMVCLETLNPKMLDKIYTRKGYSKTESAYIRMN